MISAINAKQIRVTFSLPVDSTTATTSSYYTVSGNTVTDASLESDGKTVDLTLGTPYTTSTDVVVTVASSIKLKADSNKVNPLYSTTVNVDDTTPASITSVTSSTNGTAASSVTVDFSEPVSSATFKIDGSSVTSGIAWSTDRTEVVISSLVLDASKSHTLDVLALTDYGSNITNITNQGFAVTTDTAAPVATVSALNDHQVLFVFNKAMNDTLVKAGLSIYKEDLTAESTSVSEDTANETTSHTRYIVTIADASLYANIASRTLTAKIAKSVTDSLGNAVGTNDITSAVTLHEDTTAPVINSVTYKTQSDGKVTDIVLNVSKEVKAAAVSSTGITIINSNGVADGVIALPATSVTPAAGDTSIVFHLASATTINGSYTFYLPKGLVTDSSIDANTNAATTLAATFATASSTFSIAQSAITEPNADDLTIKVAFGTPVKGGQNTGSATNAAYYTLAGAALPAGTILSLNSAMDTVTITLPSTGAVVSDDSYGILTISGVQNSNGTVITPFTGTVALKDNTAPVLQSAKLIDSEDLILTYNENMKSFSTATAAGTDFTIQQNGTTLTLTSTDATVTSVPGYANELKLTLTSPLAFDLTKVITITANSSSSVVKDASSNGNVQAASSSTITVTK